MKFAILKFCGIKSKAFTVHNTSELTQANIKTSIESPKNAIQNLVTQGTDQKRKKSKIR